MHRLRSTSARYALAALLVCLACLLHFVAGPPDVSSDVEYFAFTAAVAGSAIVGGLGPGLLATGLSALVIAYVLLPPFWSMRIASPEATSRLVLFATEGVVLSFGCRLIRDGDHGKASASYIEKYLSPPVFALLATGLKLVLLQDLKRDFPFALFYAATAASAWAGGFASGLLATFLCSLCSRYFFLEPRFSLAIESQVDILRLSLFMIEGIILSYLSARDTNARRVAVEAMNQVRRLGHRLETSIQDVSALRAISRDMIWELDLKNARMICGRTDTERGRTPGATMTFGSWLEEIHPKDRLKILASLRAALEEGRREWSCEYRRLCPGGKYGHVSDHGFIIWDESRKPVRVVGRSAEVNSETRVSQALENEISYHALFENNPHAILLADKALRIIDANDAACDLFGYEKSEISKLPIGALFDRMQRDEAVEKLAHVDPIDGSTVTFSGDCLRTDGEIFRAQIGETIVSGMHQMAVDRMITIEQLDDEGLTAW